MRVIEYEGDRGLAAYARVMQYPESLCDAARIDDLTGEAAVRALMGVLAAIQTTAFETIGNPPYGPARVEHLLRVGRHNPGVLLRVPYPCPVAIRFAGEHLVHYGPTVGCTTVYPLTPDSYDYLVATDQGVGKVFPGGVVNGRDCDRDKTSLYVAGVIDLRRVPPPHGGGGLSSIVAEALLRHVARFCVPFRWHAERTLVPSRGDHLPRFLAFADPGTGSAEQLWRNGFRPVGKLWDGATKFELDLEGWNRGFDPERRDQCLRVIRALQWEFDRTDEDRGPRG